MLWCVCHSLLKMELYDNKEILFLHLTYILLFIFLFQVHGMNVGISVALLKLREKNARMIQSFVHSGGRNRWYVLFEETWHHFIDLMNIFLLKGNILFYSAFFFFWPLQAACGILVPPPGIKPMPPPLEACCFNQ